MHRLQQVRNRPTPCEAYTERAFITGDAARPIKSDFDDDVWFIHLSRAPSTIGQNSPKSPGKTIRMSSIPDLFTGLDANQRPICASPITSRIGGLLVLAIVVHQCC